MFSHQSCDLQDLQDTLSPYWISKIQQITKFSAPALPKVPRKKKAHHPWRLRAHNVLEFVSETPSLIMKRGRKHGYSFMNDAYYKSTRLTLSHYQQVHQQYTETAASQWIEKVKSQHDSRYLLEKMFAESLMEGWSEWTAHLRPLVSSKLDLLEHLEDCVRQGNVSALKRLLPYASDRDVWRTCNMAIDHQNVEMVELTIARSNPTAQNSRLLQMVAANHFDNPALLHLAIQWCDPGKAARHLLYLRDPLPADRILSHEGTPVELIAPALEYASSNGQDLPHAKARYEKHLLSMQLAGIPDQDSMQKRKM